MRAHPASDSERAPAAIEAWRPRGVSAGAGAFAREAVRSAAPGSAARAVPELVRRIHLASCGADPPAALVAVLGRMVKSGTAISDLLADSGYAYRVAEKWALPVRRLGASLVQELHPNDRGRQGTHMGAIRANGNLYCPATPTADQAARHQAGALPGHRHPPRVPRRALIMPTSTSRSPPPEPDPGAMSA